MRSRLLCHVALIAVLCCGCLGPVEQGGSTPATGRNVVVAVIEDSLKRDNKSPQIDYGFWKGLGCEFNLIESKSERATHFKTQVDRVGMPAMVIYDAETMLVLKSERLPDKAGIASAVSAAKSKPRIPQEKK